MNKYQGLHTQILLFIIASIFTTGCTVRKGGNNAFSFIQMSDPQFGMFRKDTSFEYETAHFEKAISEANRLKPAFVVVTGDLINRPFDAPQMAEYKRIIKQLDPSIPLYSVPGNHDVGNTPVPNDITKYRSSFGDEYYTFSYGSMLGIVLNSVYLHSPQNVPNEAKQQEDWLIKTLQTVNHKKYKNIFVFLHHPLFLKEENEADEYFNIPQARRKKYLDLFAANGVKYIFAGHYHRNAFGRNANLDMVTTGPVGLALGKDPSGFRIITVSGTSVSHRYYALDSMPGTIR